MSNINLLPEAFKVTGSAVKLNKTFKKLATLSLFLLLIIVSVSIGVFFVFSQRLEESITRQNSLKSEIKTLEETEQRLVLVKDRLSNVGEIYSKESSSEEVIVFEDMLNQLPQGVNILSALLEGEDLNIAVRADSTTAFGSLLDTLVSSQLFSQITINSYSYSPSGGHQSEFLMTRNL